MTALPAEASPLYAYLTVVGDLQGGMLGGALVIDPRGRPIEFHCTDMLEVSRAEEILYGSTLESHLYCDRIGASLAARLGGKVVLILVDRCELVPLADVLSVPVVLLQTSSDQSSVPTMAGPAGAASLPDVVAEKLEALKRYIPLAEPFSRIVEALREAGQVAPPVEVPSEQAA